MSYVEFLIGCIHVDITAVMFVFFLKIAGGRNLIVDVPVKAKKPTLSATTLMTHLFSDEEMREGNSSELIHDARKYLEY